MASDLTNEVLLNDLNEKLKKMAAKLDAVLDSVSGYENRIRLIESNQINNNFDLVNLKNVFDNEVKKRVELENKMMGLEDLVIKYYSKIHSDIQKIEKLIKNGQNGKEK